MSNITLTTFAPRSLLAAPGRSRCFPVASEAGFAALFLAVLALALLA
ncbi:MAG: hypothetical protein ACKOSS_01895 [Planctomycetia bacterium]